MTLRYALGELWSFLMAKQSVTVRVEPELVRWFREEAQIPLGEAVNEALKVLQRRLQSQELQQRNDRDLADGESLVSQADRDYWDQLSDGWSHESV